MLLTLHQMQKRIPQLNRTALTDLDFWRISRREKIIVREIALAVNGYYEQYRGRHYIILNRDLRGVVWLQTAFHEMFHYFLHSGSRTFFNNGGDSKPEKEADALALIALIPLPVLVMMSDNPQGDLAALIPARSALYAEYQI